MNEPNPAAKPALEREYSSADITLDQDGLRALLAPYLAGQSFATALA